MLNIEADYWLLRISRYGQSSGNNTGVRANGSLTPVVLSSGRLQHLGSFGCEEELELAKAP
jgi:hypothetical protein